MKFAVIVAGVFTLLWIAGGITTASVMIHTARNAPDPAWWTGEDDDALELEHLTAEGMA